MTPSMRSRLARTHQREADGSLTALRELELPQDPERHMGGHGLYATVGDYMRFIRMWLNDGAGKNGLGNKKIKMLPGVIPSLSNDAEFFPGMPKSWALTFMINDVDAPTSRNARLADLANLYYWIDRRTVLAASRAGRTFP